MTKEMKSKELEKLNRIVEEALKKKDEEFDRMVEKNKNIDRIVGQINVLFAVKSLIENIDWNEDIMKDVMNAIIG